MERPILSFSFNELRGQLFGLSSNERTDEVGI